MDFSNFKVTLRNSAENESARVAHCDSNDNIYHVYEVTISCFSCGKSGHKKLKCPKINSNQIDGVTIVVGIRLIRVIAAIKILLSMWMKKTEICRGQIPTCSKYL